MKKDSWIRLGIIPSCKQKMELYKNLENNNNNNNNKPTVAYCHTDYFKFLSVYKKAKNLKGKLTLNLK